MTYFPVSINYLDFIHVNRVQNIQKWFCHTIQGPFQYALWRLVVRSLEVERFLFELSDRLEIATKTPVQSPNRY